MKRQENVMCRMEARLDREEKVLEDLGKFGRKALDEIYRLHDSNVKLNRASSTGQAETAGSSSVSDSMSGSSSVSSSMLYNGHNLLAQGGQKDSDVLFNMIKVLFSEEERKGLIIGSSRDCGRVQADEDRVQLLREAFEQSLGDGFTVLRFADALKLANQRMREKRVRKSNNLNIDEN